MPRPNRLDVFLRDEAKNMLGRTPAQSWLKPERVELAKPRLITLRDLIAQHDKDYVDRAELRFVLEPPWKEIPRHANRVRPSPDLLERFLRLATAPAQQIQEFAARFGALLIFCRIDGSLPHKLVIVESCAVWRYFAASMRSLLRIAFCFRANRRPDPADWNRIGACPVSLVPAKKKLRDLLSPTPFGGEEEWIALAHFVRKGSDRDRKMWAQLLNALMELGRVRPWLVWDGAGSSAGPKLVFSGPTLLSYLALQLGLMASKHDGFAGCSYCNRQYVPLRRAPKAGQKNFCPECRASGVPVRVAQRSRRERLREQNLAGA